MKKAKLKTERKSGKFNCKRKAINIQSKVGRKNKLGKIYLGEGIWFEIGGENETN